MLKFWIITFLTCYKSTIWPRLHLMLSDDTVENGACLIRYKLYWSGNMFAGRVFHSLAVRIRNDERNRLVRQGISTTCRWSDRLRLVSRWRKVDSGIRSRRCSRVCSFASIRAESPMSLLAYSSIESRAASWYLAEPSQRWQQNSWAEQQKLWLIQLKQLLQSEVPSDLRQDFKL